MSEYQYYEFQAIDRPLTDRQMRELREISTRAVITRTRFSNYYTYGDLKANPRELFARYFDASLYLALWHMVEVAFRFPQGGDRCQIASALPGRTVAGYSLGGTRCHHRRVR